MWWTWRSAGRPGPDRGGRAGEAAAVDGDHLVDLVGRGRRLTGDAHGPPALGGRAGHGDVAAEAHERAAADGAAMRAAARSAANAFAVEPRSSRTPRGIRARPVARVELHVLVPGHRPERPGRAGGRDRHLVEVGVVAEGGDGIADGRVDGAAGALGGVERDLERLEEQRADLDGAAGVGVEALQLGVVAEPAAGQVDGVELVGEEALRLVRRCGVLHDDGRGGADGAEGASGEGAASAVHVTTCPPEVTVESTNWTVDLGAVVVVVVVVVVLPGVA